MGLFKNVTFSVHTHRRPAHAPTPSPCGTSGDTGFATTSTYGTFHPAAPQLPGQLPGQLFPFHPGLTPPPGVYGPTLYQPVPQTERRTLTIDSRFDIERYITRMRRDGFSYVGKRELFPLHILTFERTSMGFAQYPERVTASVRSKFDIKREADKFERDGWCLNEVVDQFPNHILTFTRMRVTPTPQG